MNNEKITIKHNIIGDFKKYENGKYVFLNMSAGYTVNQKIVDSGYVFKRYDQNDYICYYEKEFDEKVFDKIVIRCSRIFSEEEKKKYNIIADTATVDLQYPIPAPLKKNVMEYLKSHGKELIEEETPLFNEIIDYFSIALEEDVLSAVAKEYKSENGSIPVSDACNDEITELKAALDNSINQNAKEISVTIVKEVIHRAEYGSLIMNKRDNIDYIKVRFCGDDNQNYYDSDYEKMVGGEKNKIKLLKTHTDRIFKLSKEVATFPYTSIEINWIGEQYSVTYEFEHEKYQGAYDSTYFKKHAIVKAKVKGTGVIPRNMYGYGARWTGADISENQIEQARTGAAVSVDDTFDELLSGI